jgi:hypothetical protein
MTISSFNSKDSSNNERHDDDFRSIKGSSCSGDSIYSDDSDDGGDAVSSNYLTSYQARRKERKQVRNSIISKLESELHHVCDQIENLKIELEFRRAAGEIARADHSKKVEAITMTTDSVMWKYDKISNQDTQRRSSLGGYVSIMRGVTGPGSMYVQTIEGQACRSLHLLNVKKKQRDLMNRQAQEMVQSMKRSIQELEDENAELSKNVTTKSFEIECMKRDYARRCETVLEKQRMLIVGLEARSR